jgi:hypothetical protein
MKAPGRDQSFVEASIKTPVGWVPRVRTRLTFADTLGHWRVRWGIRRDDYKVDPGLYAIGEPDPDSPVLVTANYKLTFDIVRSSLRDLNAWILVLDTRGINVWCAAGKHTFSTEELVNRIKFDRLGAVVKHRRVIVPQLGATGIEAHEVKDQTGFRVTYGPVRIADLPAFIAAGFKATPAMRQPTFTLKERLVLTPVELTGAWKQIAVVLAVFVAFALVTARPFELLTVWNGFWRSVAPFTLGLIGGAVITPLILPWVPVRQFAAKGAIVGLILAIAWLLLMPGSLAAALATFIIVPAVTSFFAMNFTGSTPYTSLSGVEREMRRWLPIQVGALAVAAVVIIIGGFIS